MKNKSLLKVGYIKFVSWKVSDPLTNVTMADYKKWSTGSAYNFHTGTDKYQGYIYYFSEYLKKFWYRNGGVLNEARALSKSDLLRVMKAHYHTIHKDFAVIEVPRWL